MLQNTFCHIPGIGLKAEQQLWASGLRCWADIAGRKDLPVTPRKAETLSRQVQESLEHLAGRNPRYFYDRLPSNQHWRLFPEFRDSVAYVDIETTGLGVNDYITAMTLYDGRTIRHYVHDENLLAFKEDIEPYQLVVTYNGKSFDLPIIRNYLRIPMQQAHIDLRHVLGSLGYRGGLKICEKRLGIDRQDLADVDGYFAVLLWFDWHNNRNRRALETLLAYNTLDVVNLEALMFMAYNLKLRGTPFQEDHRLEVPKAPRLPHKADRETIDRLRAGLGSPV